MKRKKSEKSVEGKVFVNSRAYGEHYRAARGTHKEAVLNEAFKASAAALDRCNKDGRLIKRELERYCGNPKPVLLWQRLLSVLRTAYRQSDQMNVAAFEGFDVYDQYKITRLFSPTYRVTPSTEGIEVELKWRNAPNFKRKFPEGYQFGMVCVRVDPIRDYSESSVEYSEIFPMGQEEGTCTFQTGILGQGYVLLFLTINATEKGKLCNTMATSGFRCIWGGERGLSKSQNGFRML